MKINIISLLLILSLTGCASVVAPFIQLKPNYTLIPEDTIRQIAHDIEAHVEAGNRDVVLKNSGGVIIDTPEIRQAIRTRCARIELIKDFRASGFAKEQENGLISIIRNKAYKKATSRRERDKNALLVMSENNNRWTIYEGLIKANNYAPASLSAIQTIFYETRQ